MYVRRRQYPTSSGFGQNGSSTDYALGLWIAEWMYDDDHHSAQLRSNQYVFRCDSFLLPLYAGFR